VKKKKKTRKRENETQRARCCGPRRKNRPRRENSRWSGIGGGKPETRETEQVERKASREAREAKRETRDEEDHRAAWSFGFRGVFTRAVADR
jgi:hypothetical protein